MKKEEVIGQLFAALLDIKYSQELQVDHIHDLGIETKLAKAGLRKSKRLFEKGIAKYTKLHGSPPKLS